MNNIYNIYGESTKFDDEKYSLVIFMGQSNMLGQSESAGTATSLTDEGYQFKSITDPTRLYVASEPFGNGESNSSMTCIGSGGMVTSIMKAYNEKTGNKLIGVMSAVKGSGIDEWQPDGDYLTETIRRLSVTKTWLSDNGYELDHVYGVWCQGEHEAIGEADGPAYIESFSNVWNALKAAGVEKCFLVRIGYAESTSTNDGFSAIMNAQNSICKNDPDCIMASTRLSTMQGRGECATTYHYTQTAYNEVGFDVGYNIAYYELTGKDPVMYDNVNDELYYSKFS